MIIQVTPDVFWDTEATEQTEAAIEWLQTEVRPNLSEPTIDAFNRPLERTFSNDVVTVTEKQLYITESYDWARRGVKYTVKSATNAN